MFHNLKKVILFSFLLIFFTSNTKQILSPKEQVVLASCWLGSGLIGLGVISSCLWESAYNYDKHSYFHWVNFLTPLLSSGVLSLGVLLYYKYFKKDSMLNKLIDGKINVEDFVNKKIEENSESNTPVLDFYNNLKKMRKMLLSVNDFASLDNKNNQKLVYVSKVVTFLDKCMSYVSELPDYKVQAGIN